MQKGLYTLKLSDGSTIEIAFTTWVFKKFAQSKSLSVDGLLDYISKNLLKTEDMLALMLYGAEFMALKNNKPFEYTDFHACGWLDDMGGLTSTKLKEMTVVMLASLVDKDPTDVQKLIEVEVEKKSSHGIASTSAQEKRGLRQKKQTAKR